MRRVRPRVLKVSWHFGIGPNKFCRLWAAGKSFASVRSQTKCAWNDLKCPKVPGTFSFRSNACKRIASLPRVCRTSLGRFQSARKLLELWASPCACAWSFGHFRPDQAHAQGVAESSKSFLALWNRPKLVLQTLGKLAIRLQALDRKLNVPGTFGHLRPDQAHAHGEAQSSKSFLALWNRPKLVLQTLGKLAIRLQALDRKLNVPGMT